MFVWEALGMPWSMGMMVKEPWSIREGEDIEVVSKPGHLVITILEFGRAHRQKVKN